MYTSWDAAGQLSARVIADSAFQYLFNPRPAPDCGPARRIFATRTAKENRFARLNRTFWVAHPREPWHDSIMMAKRETSNFAIAALLATFVACGGDDSNGSAGGGGSAGSGGSSASGGSSGATGGTGGTQTGGAAGMSGGGTGGVAGQAGTGGTAGSAATGGSAGSTGGGGSAGSPMPQFTPHILDDAADGPAFAVTTDINNDGKLDVVVSMFGKMGFSVPDADVRAYIQGATLDDWTEQPLMPPASGYKWPNEASVEDIDGDGDPDLFVPLGFLACEANPLVGACGALVWLENTPGGWTIHELVPHGSQLFFHHVEFVDIDGDGIRDAITVGERKPSFGASVSKVMWFKGTATGDRFDVTPFEIGEGLGSIPTAVDLDADGDLDLISAEFFHANAASFAWMENPGDPSQPFTRHVIADDVGPSIQLTLVPDLYGDGVTRAIGSNHTNTTDNASLPESAVYVLDVPAPASVKTAGPWPKVKISQGIVSAKSPMFGPQAAPGIFGTGDIDGDGDIDVLLSGDGDPHVYWLRQMGPGQFETHVLEPQLKQAGGMKVVDLNGDGKNELIVTGYEAGAVQVYERQ